MHFLCSIDIALTPENLFPWISRPDKAMLWQKGVKGSEILLETPERIGTTFKEVFEEDGKQLEMNGMITGFVQNESISFYLESKIHTVDVSYAMSVNEEKSTLEVKGTVKWKFPMNLVNLFIGRKIRNRMMQQTESELAELKRLCESKKFDSSEN